MMQASSTGDLRYYAVLEYATRFETFCLLLTFELLIKQEVCIAIITE
jgi:hypothetical protein